MSKCVYCGNEIPKEDEPYTEFCSLDCVNMEASQGLFLDTKPNNKTVRTVETSQEDFEI